MAAIHGMEEAEGATYLVLELVPGETLRERLDRGKLPHDEALALCSQVAAGLAAAPAESLRWQMNGREFSFDELRTNTEEWWFPTDSAGRSGDLPVDPDAEHEVTVGLTLYIPYIIISDTETLHIDETNTKTMKAVAA